MELEAALGMLESLGKLRKLLEEHAREMQRLKIENDWLKMVLKDCEKKRVDTEGRYIIDMTRPQPCTRFRNAGTVEWIAKLMEETNEAVQEAYTVSQLEQSNKKFPCETMNEVIHGARERLALELTDVIHVCVSWLDAEGWDEEARSELHRYVNEKNKDRGYF